MDFSWRWLGIAVFTPLNPQKENLSHMFWRMESKSFERKPQEQIFLLFSLLVKSCFSKVCQDETFPMEISIWEGKSGAFVNQIFFTSPSYSPFESTPPRVSVTFILCRQDKLHFNTGWIGSRLKKGYWKFINPTFPSFGWFGVFWLFGVF